MAPRDSYLHTRILLTSFDAIPLYGCGYLAVIIAAGSTLIISTKLSTVIDQRLCLAVVITIASASTVSIPLPTVRRMPDLEIRVSQFMQ